MQTFGIAFGLSDAILGLTFLAWGNSLGGEYWLNLLLIHNQQSFFFSHSSLRTRVKKARAKTVLFFSVPFSLFSLPLFPPASLVMLLARRTTCRRREELLMDLS